MGKYLFLGIRHLEHLNITFIEKPRLVEEQQVVEQMAVILMVAILEEDKEIVKMDI